MEIERLPQTKNDVHVNDDCILNSVCWLCLVTNGIESRSCKQIWICGELPVKNFISKFSGLIQRSATYRLLWICSGSIWASKSEAEFVIVWIRSSRLHFLPQTCCTICLFAALFAIQENCSITILTASLERCPWHHFTSKELLMYLNYFENSTYVQVMRKIEFTLQIWGKHEICE